jgi:probable rRNA maturation factor
VDIFVEDLSHCPSAPSVEQIQGWARQAMQDDVSYYEELNIRLVDRAESLELNSSFRGRPHATNVLSFPFEDPPDVESGILGDIAICAEVVLNEATEQRKQPSDHFAHMVIHGVLHLRGFDHENDEQAEQMENLETQLLSDVGIANPYKPQSETELAL